MSTWLSSYDSGEEQTTFRKRILWELSWMHFLAVRDETLAVGESILGD